MPWQESGKKSGFGDSTAGIDAQGTRPDGGGVRRYGRRLLWRDCQRLCGGEPAGMVLHGAFVYDPGKEEKLGDPQIFGSPDFSSAKAAAAVCPARRDFDWNHDDGSCGLGEKVSGVASRGQQSLSTAGRASGADHHRPCARERKTDEVSGELRLFYTGTYYGHSPAG